MDYPSVDVSKAVEAGFIESDDELTIAMTHQLNYLCEQQAKLAEALAPIIELFNALQGNPMLAGMIPGMGSLPKLNGSGPVLPPGMRMR